MVFCLEHPKRDQNLKFTLLPARRRASPHLSYGSPSAPGICSRQFQFFHCKFILLTPISILLTAISICSWQFQFVHGNFNLLTAISIYSRQFRNFTQGNFNFFTATLTAFFASLTTCQLRRPTVATHQKSKHKIKSGYLQSIFKEKSENRKSKVDLRTSRTRGYLRETGTNSDWCEFVSVAIHFFSCIYRTENELRPV